VLLLFYYSLARLTQTKLVKNPQIIFLLLWFFLYSAAYLAVGWAGDYPRYFAPVMPPLFLLAGKVLNDDLSKFKSKYSYRNIFLVVAVSFFLIILAHKNGYLFLDHITGWVASLQTPFFAIILLGVLAVTFSLKSKLSIFMLSTLAFLVLGQLTIQYVHDLKSNYSLTNFYGTSGVKEGATYLRKNLNQAEDIIFTFDPVAYYWGGRYYDFVNSTNGLDLTDKELIAVISSDSISAFALPKAYYDELALIARDYGFDFNSFLLRHYKNYKKFGENIPTEVYYR
jgi:hypothetical protein